MKKFLATLIASVMLLGILSGCSAGRLASELGSALSGALSDLGGAEGTDETPASESEESLPDPDESEESLPDAGESEESLPDASEPEESLSDPGEPEEESAVSGDGTTRYDPSYLNWNQNDWENATATQKRECALAYLMYVAEKMGQSGVVTPEMFEGELDEMVTTLEALFGTMELTGFKDLREATDFGMGLLSSDD